MKVPLEWLKELVNIKMTASQLAKTLTMGGLETTVDGDALEVDILPNRADCWSILGIAREVAALTKTKLGQRKIKAYRPIGPKASGIKVIVKDKKKCPRYMARVIENVKIKDSPEWLKKRLESAGVRSINNVVDVTNYLLLEVGQPMHAFDARLISGRKIIVRRAEPGEKITTLDGGQHELQGDMLVIADADKAIAVAGVMGAANTEVSQDTKTVILESAYFDRVSVHRTSSNLKIRTESSIRFGHGVDWEMVAEALDRAADMIAKLSGGSVLKGKVDVKAAPKKPQKVAFRPARANQILGTDISPVEMKSLLKRLGFGVSGTTVTIPLWRAHDVEREADIVEEIARLYGYHNIETTMPRSSFPGQAIDKTDLFHNQVRQILAGCGLTETQTFTLVGPKDFERIGSKVENALPVANPMTIEEGFMRTKLIPSLLNVLQHNLNRQMENVYVFEIGKVFIPGLKKLPQEKWMLAAAITGSPFMSALDKGKADYLYLKGILDNLMDSLGIEGFRFVEADDKDKLLQPAKGAHIPGVGIIGQLHPDVARNYGFDQPVCFFELDLEALLSRASKQKKYKPLPKFPSVARDISLFVPQNIEHQMIIDVIRKIGGELVENVFLFDKFKDSQAYRIIYRRPQRTLTDEEVNSIHNEISRNLESKLNVRVR
ncbi:MAG: phenylalanine--tRNA ligase subunit beta [bacterium]